MRRLFASLALLACSISTFAATAQEVIEKEYKGKVVQLRHPRCGSELHLDNQTSVGNVHDEPWTICGRLRIESILADKGEIVITARRFFLVYARRFESMEDIEGYFRDPAMFQEIGQGRSASVGNEIKASEKEIREALSPLRSVKIFLRPETLDATKALQAMQKAFAEEDEFQSVVPDSWKFAASSERSKFPVVAPMALHLTPEMKPPRAILDPDPSYTEIARKVKFQGVAVLFLVIDESGKPQSVQVAKPLGLGLDDNAVETVRGWKFEPAEKDGRPVPVMVNVEVTFKLY